jgi:hypothetical protein
MQRRKPVETQQATVQRESEKPKRMIDEQTSWSTRWCPEPLSARMRWQKTLSILEAKDKSPNFALEASEGFANRQSHSLPIPVRGNR